MVTEKKTWSKYTYCNMISCHWENYTYLNCFHGDPHKYATEQDITKRLIYSIRYVVHKKPLLNNYAHVVIVIFFTTVRHFVIILTLLLHCNMNMFDKVHSYAIQFGDNNIVYNLFLFYSQLPNYVVPRARLWKYPKKLEENISVSEFRGKPRLCKYPKKLEENIPASEFRGWPRLCKYPKNWKKQIFVILDGFNLSTCYFYVRDS